MGASRAGAAVAAASWVLLAGVLGGAAAAAGAGESVEEEDLNGDGRVDEWVTLDEHGKKLRSARDTNGDARPDQYKEWIRGRELLLRSFDRNHDARIDKRSLSVWDNQKSIPQFDGNKMTRLVVPGYRTLWSEEDNDYDGKVDAFKERGKAQTASPRIGKLIDAPLEESRASAGAPGEPEEDAQAETPMEKRVRELNERLDAIQ